VAHFIEVDLVALYFVWQLKLESNFVANLVFLVDRLENFVLFALLNFFFFCNPTEYCLESLKIKFVLDVRSIEEHLLYEIIQTGHFTLISVCLWLLVNLLLVEAAAKHFPGVLEGVVFVHICWVGFLFLEGAY
jgi:hypothetical protein